jgi:hypothetical protein
VRGVGWLVWLTRLLCWLGGLGDLGVCGGRWKIGQFQYKIKIPNFTNENWLTASLTGYATSFFGLLMGFLL